MKKFLLRAGLLASGLLAMLGTLTPAKADQEISSISEDSPLYLDHSPSHAVKGDVVIGWHYSHQSHHSHQSHYSHESHRSHYSGY